MRVKTPENTNQMRLLDRVAYLFREHRSDKDLRGMPLRVRDTFPYNPDSKTAPETAMRWARNYGYGKKPEVDPVPVIVKNEPFEVRFVGIEVRSEGGRAYKVVSDDGLMFDLREDQVVDAIRMHGIYAGGRISGTFVWGILGSQVRLVLVGGELHTLMVEATNAAKAAAEKRASGTAPTPGSLVVGRVYRKHDGTFQLFVGRVKVPGNDKAQYAFVKMPEPPMAEWWYDGHVSPNVGRPGLALTKEAYAALPEVIREKEVRAKWGSMSWTERCEWSWHHRYAVCNSDRTDHPPIVLMSQPKLDSDAGEAAGLAEAIRTNEGARHRYTNGHGDDVAEKRWEAENGGSRQRVFDYDYGIGLGWDERQRIRKERMQQREREATEYRARFRSLLAWT